MFNMLLDTMLMQLRVLSVDLIDTLAIFFLLFLADLYALVAPLIGQA